MPWLDRLNPRSTSRGRLLLAALVWTAVGGGLATAGLAWALERPRPAVGAGLGAAAVAGWLKGRLVLAPRARANAARIVAAGDGRCIGGTFSWTTWMMVAGFATVGALLRRLPVPRTIVGCVYVAVGLALLLGAWTAWRSWLGSDAKGRA